MRITVAEGFRCSPSDVLKLTISEVLYHLCYIIDKNQFTDYLTTKQKASSK
jgi:hypothetical protein